MTRRDGFPRLLAGSAWRGDAGHRKPWAVRKPWETAVPVGQANRQRANRWGRRQASTMCRIARGFPPTRPLARRIACPISMGHYQRDWVLTGPGPVRHRRRAAINGPSPPGVRIARKVPDFPGADA